MAGNITINGGIALGDGAQAAGQKDSINNYAPPSPSGRSLAILPARDLFE